jgi:hypothetical protein
VILTIDAGQAKTIGTVILTRMTASPAFTRQGNAVVLPVLQQKQAQDPLR